MEPKLQIEGLREFQRTLRFLPDEVKKEVKRTNQQLAEIIAQDARSRANSRPGVKNRTFGVSQSIKSGFVLREPAIRVGGHKRRGQASSDARVQEFGGRAPLFGNRQRWFQVRPREKEGYFLYPAVRAKRDVIAKGYLDALDKALRRAQ
jgi:hypothetical protein